MIDMETTLHHHLFEIAITQGIPKIPTYAQEEDVALEMALFERELSGHNEPSCFSFSPTVADQLSRCNTL